MENTSTKNELDFLLERQHLIVAYNKQKLEIVNHIVSGRANNDRSIIRSDFLLFTALVFYRSIIIDLCALFVNSSSHANNFHNIYKSQTILQHLNPNVPRQIKLLIKHYSQEIERLQVLRNTQFAHHDFEKKPALHFNFDEIEAVNGLYKTAETILVTCGNERIAGSVGYELWDSDYLNSLILLLSHQPANDPINRFQAALAKRQAKQ